MHQLIKIHMKQLSYWEFTAPMFSLKERQETDYSLVNISAKNEHLRPAHMVMSRRSVHQTTVSPYFVH